MERLNMFEVTFTGVSSGGYAANVTYNNTTSGLTATNVQDAIDEVQGEIDNLPSPPDPSNVNPQDLGTASAGSSADYSRADHVHNKPTAADIGAQAKINASGILKGDGQGGVTAATPGTDYQTPLTAGTDYATPGMIPSVPIPSDLTPQNLGTAAAGSSANYSRADHVHQKPTYSKTDVGLGNVDNVQQYSANNPPPYPVTSVNGNIGAVTVQSTITANGILKGDGQGNISAAIAGTDYQAPLTAETDYATPDQLAD